MIKSSNFSSTAPVQSTDNTIASSDNQDGIKRVSQNQDETNLSSKKSWEAEDVLKKDVQAKSLAVPTGNEQSSPLAVPKPNADSTLFSLSPENQRRGANLAKKGTKSSEPSYQQMYSERVSNARQYVGSASNRVKQIIALRGQSLESSDSDKHAPVPAAERVNHMRHHRSIGDLKNDPTLTLPVKQYFPGINSEPVENLPFLQRPGPETRINSVNKSELVRAFEKHGSYRKPDLQGSDLRSAVNLIMKEQGLSESDAFSKAKNTTFSGGWEKPPVSKDKSKAKPGEDSSTRKLVFSRAKSLVSNINWDPQTKLRTESRGREAPGKESYSDPVHNPQGNLITHESPSGRGVRYSTLNGDHVAESRNHDGSLHLSEKKKDLRTLRGFTNPPPFSAQSNAAETERLRKDVLSELAEAAKEKARSMFSHLKKKK